jgi:mono/diheme cytochrome c family protein
MRSKLVRVFAICVFAVGIVTMADAQRATPNQKSFDLGKIEYESKCASCHGILGKGDGPNAPWLNRTASDLTVLAKNNNGVFPVARMYEVIDGTQQVAGHGNRDMPTWGREFRIQAGEYYMELPYDPEFYVRTRILAVIEYMHRLQAK